MHKGTMQWRGCSDKRTAKAYQNEKKIQEKCKEDDQAYFIGAGETAQNPASNAGAGYQDLRDERNPVCGFPAHTPAESGLHQYGAEHRIGGHIFHTAADH